MGRLLLATIVVLTGCAQIPSAAPERSVTWSGVVLAPDGAPGASATIEVIRDQDDEPMVIAEGRAGPDGAFSVRFPPCPSATLSVVCPGIGAGRLERLDGGQDLSGIEIDTLPVSAVRGVVVDEDGRPVPGAIVSLRQGYWDATVTLTRTGTDGTFAVPNLLLRGVAIEVRHPGFVVGRAGAVPGTGSCRIVLEGGVTLEGIVLASDGSHHVPDTRISVWGHRATSDAAGRFRVSGVPHDEKFRLVARAAGVGMVEVRDLLWAPDTVLRVLLWPAVRMEGRVVHAETGRGVEGVEVGASLMQCHDMTLYHLSQGDPVITGPDGGFAFRGYMEDGTHGIVSPDWQTLLEDAGSEDRSRLHVLRVVPTVPLHGCVLSPDGRPVAGARVSCMESPAGDAITDRQGRFTLRNVRDRLPFNRVLACKDGLLGFTDVRGSGEEVLVTLSPRATLEGRVVDEAGRPVGGVRVSASGNIAREGTDTYTRSAWTRRDGTFRIEDLDDDGQYRVSADHPDFESVEVPVTLPLASPFPIVLRRPKILSGRVVDEKGQPIAGASIGRDTVSDADGRFVLRVDSGDRVQEQIRAHGYQAGYLSEDSLQEDGSLLVTLRPGRRVEGTVLDLEGRPLPAVRIHAGLVDGFESGWALSDIAGKFVIDGLAEGEYTISGYQAGRIFATEVKAPAGARGVILREIEGVAVAGRVVDKHGRGVRVNVVAVPKGIDTTDHLKMIFAVYHADGARSAHSDGDGQFRIEKLLGSEFVLHVHAEFYGDCVALPVPGIRAGETSARIVVERALRITGRLTGPDGSPRPDLHVIARPALSGLPMRDNYSDDDGSFEITALYPTTYSLEVRSRKDVERGGRQEVAAGTEGLTIALED